MASGGRLTQRVALVTGGGGEIGGAICRGFAAEGAEVAVADLAPAKSEAVARVIAGSGGRVLALQVDVADEASAKDAVERTIASFGRLTTLVNVAATVTPDGTVETLSLDDWNNAIAVNLTGAFVMCKYAVPELRRAGGGSIINIASQLGHLGVPLRSPYCTTKAALIHFTRILAM
ncbi:MAG TPA: SDR family NAD(P)-dependent oxidoreductase, partial [Xanthobacteraceae bacterium]|nr:SDR family NAD(P)-dependent oxidoreductase [Xanthobacteraceae bacterium]